MALTKKQREKLFQKFGGKCAYCGCELQKIWHVDHIVPVVRDIEVVKKGKYWTRQSTNTHSNPHLEIIENLNPACPECNIHKSSLPLEQFRVILSKKLERLEQSSKDFRFARKFGQVQLTPSPIIFFFETISSGE